MPTLGVVASLVGGTLSNEADADVEVDNIADLQTAGPRDLTFLSNPRYAGSLGTTTAGAVLVKNADTRAPCPQVVCRDPYLAMAIVARHLHPPAAPEPGVDPGARVHPSACVDPFASVGFGSFVGAGACLAADVQVHPGCYVGAKAEIGAATVLHPGARVLDRCRVGARVILHPGVVVGSDGFGFAVDTSTGVRHKIPQLGIVVVEDDVEIGANSTIDRATFGETRIGAGTKIDNLVQVAHNVVLGRDCVLVSQTGIAGSTVVGDRFVMGAQAGAIGHLKIANDVMLGARTAVLSDIDKPGVYSGMPAMAHQKWLRVAVTQGDLPGLKRRLRWLEERMEQAAPTKGRSLDLHT